MRNAAYCAAIEQIGEWNEQFTRGGDPPKATEEFERARNSDLVLNGAFSG